MRYNINKCFSISSFIFDELSFIPATYLVPISYFPPLFYCHILSYFPFSHRVGEKYFLTCESSFLGFSWLLVDSLKPRHVHVSWSWRENSSPLTPIEVEAMARLFLLQSPTQESNGVFNLPASKSLFVTGTANNKDMNYWRNLIS